MLKKLNAGCRPKKTNFVTKEEFFKLILEAPTEKFLAKLGIEVCTADKLLFRYIRKMWSVQKRRVI